MNTLSFQKLVDCAKHITTTKISNLLMIVGITIISLCFSNVAKAQNDSIRFELDDFHVNLHANGSFHWYGQGSNRYRLTDVKYLQSIAMWHVGNTGNVGKTLDLNDKLYYNNITL